MDDLTDGGNDVESRRTPPSPAVAAGVVAGLVGLGLLGWMVYRSRLSRTAVSRLRDVLPRSLRDLRERLRSQVRR